MPEKPPLPQVSLRPSCPPGVDAAVRHLQLAAHGLFDAASDPRYGLLLSSSMDALTDIIVHLQGVQEVLRKQP